MNSIKEMKRKFIRTMGEPDTRRISSEGSLVWKWSSGFVVRYNEDGSVQYKAPTGVRRKWFPSGAIQTQWPNGRIRQELPDGTVIERFKDGTTTQRHPSSQVVLIKDADGKVEKLKVYTKNEQLHLDASDGEDSAGDEDMSENENSTDFPEDLPEFALGHDSSDGEDTGEDESPSAAEATTDAAEATTDAAEASTDDAAGASSDDGESGAKKERKTATPSKPGRPSHGARKKSTLGKRRQPMSKFTKRGAGKINQKRLQPKRKVVQGKRTKAPKAGTSKAGTSKAGPSKAGTVKFVIDGANVGYFYGRQKGKSGGFASEGLSLALNNLNADVPDGQPPVAVAILPQKFVDSKFETTLADNVKVLEKLIAKQWLFLSPSRVDDDEFIIKFARGQRCQIVTNDNFRDHLQALEEAGRKDGDREAANQAKWLRKALVKYMFVADRFLSL